jgi:thiamine pyrophosphokinase
VGKMRALIIAGGELAEWPHPLAGLDPAAPRAGCDYLVCADGGSNHAYRLGLRPELIIGDLDSMTAPTQAWVETTGIATQVYQHELKQESDTELALLAALEAGASSIVILGALGGRLDHTLANLALLALPQLEERDVAIWDRATEVRMLWPRRANRLHGSLGDAVSLIPFASNASQIVTAGLRYPLRDETLYLNHSRGISNVMLTPEATVSFSAGLLLAIITHQTS